MPVEESGWRRACRVALWTAGLIVIAATLLPLLTVNVWWVRALDFPKPQMVVIVLAVLTLSVMFFRGLHGRCLLLSGALAATALYHGWRIAPFTPVWSTEVATATEREKGRCLTVLIANVLMENRDSAPLTSEIRAHAPDIVFLVETDAWWTEALAPVAGTFETVHARPQDNHYGLIFLTDLEVVDFTIRALVDDDTPSVKARLRLPSGAAFMFYGLHPEPPVPGQSSADRDGELVMVGREVKADTVPSIVAGDLNDVAWSHTTRLFERISGLLDPRIGRGLYASYHAEYWFMRWPLDHLFHTNDFELARLEVLPGIGSDHFPVLSRLCLTADAEAENQTAEDMRGDDAEEAEAAVENAVQ